MKMRRVALMILAFSLVGAGSVFANSAYEKYNAKKISVHLNGTAIETPGLIVDFGKESRSMAPVRELAQSFGAIVNYNETEGTLNLVRPNVQLSMHTVMENVSLSEPFGIISKGKYNKLALLAQVDSLTVPVHSLRVTIIDPFDVEIERIDKPVEKQQENFWLKLMPLEINFKYTGDYKVNFQIKSTADSEYVQVSQLTIKSIQSK